MTGWRGAQLLFFREKRCAPLLLALCRFVHSDRSHLPPRRPGSQYVVNTNAQLGASSKQQSSQSHTLIPLPTLPPRSLAATASLLDVFTTFLIPTSERTHDLRIVGPPLPPGSTLQHKLLIQPTDEVAAYTSQPWRPYLSSSPSCYR